MRHWIKAVPVLAVMLCVGGIVLAQGFGRGGMGMGGPAAILARPDVQKELKLTDDQIAKVKDLSEEMREKGKEVFEKLQGTPREEMREKMTELMKPINDAANEKIAGILKPEQTKRLKQIERQQAGVRAFAEKDVQVALKLTDEQKETLKTIGEDLRRDSQDLFKGGDFQEAKKGAALNKEAMEKVTGVLTADQKKAWTELVGERFEMKMEFGGKGKGFRKKQDK